MQSLMKINGAWKEGTPYLKEGGTWKEIGAVTAKADGKWADIAPPEPALKNWTIADFDQIEITNYDCELRIKPAVKQYFSVGETFDCITSIGYRNANYATFVSTEVPGIKLTLERVNRGYLWVLGTITGGVGLTDVMTAMIYKSTKKCIYKFMTADGKPIPIKPAP